MSVEARASHDAPVGTLGFGFWNDPFSTGFGEAGAGNLLPAPPRAAWFFYNSPHGALQLGPGAGSSGWRAMCLSLPGLAGPFFLPLAAAGLALTCLPGMRTWVIQTAWKWMNLKEEWISDPLSAWHTYELIWERDFTEFRINGKTILRSTFSPSGPLGFIAWIDNQFATFTPTERVRFGIIPTETAQWLELKDLQISGMSSRRG
jgi:hypothetical protein